MYATKTIAEQISKTVKLFPHNGSIPKTVLDKEEIATYRYLIESLKTEYSNQPIANDNNSTITTLKSLTEIFHRKAEAKNSQEKPKLRHTYHR